MPVFARRAPGRHSRFRSVVPQIVGKQAWRRARRGPFRLGPGRSAQLEFQTKNVLLIPLLLSMWLASSRD